MTHEAFSFCRICSGGCGARLTVDDAGRIVDLRGDQESPLTAGYMCFKGLQAEESHHGTERLLHALKRQRDGSYARIASEQALEEIASKMSMLIDRHGPRAVAVFCGNGSMFSAAAYAMHRNFLQAIGSDQYFSTLTIDQSAKYISFGRLGGWAAGYPDFEAMDVAMLFGANPLISHASLGFLSVDPVRRLRRARERGLKLIVIDPRRTETARNADLALHPYPGQDAAVAGGVIRVVLDEGWQDRQFCDAHVGSGRMDQLRRAVEPLTEAYVEARAGLKSGDIRAVAEMFARDGKVGSVYGATGPAMQPFSNLAQHMIDCLNMICGRYLRAGETVHRVNVLEPISTAYAEVIPPMRGWEAGGPSRIRGARVLYGERPTGTLTDEILTPGTEQIRALILGGGNPLTSFPDQQKAAKAMQAIDLLVSIDPWLGPGASYAHYILPPTLRYERADLPLNLPGYAMWPGTWSQYTPAAIQVPAGSDLVQDWYVYWAIAKRLGRAIHFNGEPLPLDKVPTCDEVLAALIRGGPVTLDELKLHPHGIFIDLPVARVQPARPEAKDNKFDPMPVDVADELSRFLSVEDRPGHIRRDRKIFTHLLSSRRMRDMFNSNGSKLRAVRKRTPYNPAYLNPLDLEALGITEGDRVELVSAHGRVLAIVGKDADLRPGVVSMAHGWGALPDDTADPSITGSSVNALIDTDVNFESINAMPHMTAVPVNIVPLK